MQRQEPLRANRSRKGEELARNSKRSYGSGCVIRRGKGFAIRWRETQLFADGTKRFVNRCEALGPVSKRKAVEILNERLAEARAVQRPIVTFDELATAWRTTVLPMYKYSSRITREDTLDRKLVPRFGKLELTAVSKREIQSYMAELNRAEYAPHSIHHVHSVLSAILGKAVEWGYLDSNPAHRVELPKLVPVRSKWVLTPAQARQLLEALPLMPRTMVGLAILTGMRRGELFALRWKHFDEQTSCLSIAEAVYDGHFDTPKTDKSKRLLPLSPASIELLNRWKRSSKRKGRDDLIFGTRAGKVNNSQNILQRYVFPVCERLKLPRATWLTFRRTFSSWSHDRGVPDKVTAELMGHSRIYTTLNVYTQVMNASLRNGANRIGEELFATCSQSEEAGLLVN
ncbi:MAG TPA: tyrosine-type recombinase/integrase [Terriglobia bacterium]|nr:tyrosine-type recombinase/integrase [Terriglobia bacterium]